MEDPFLKDQVRKEIRGLKDHQKLLEAYLADLMVKGHTDTPAWYDSYQTMLQVGKELRQKIDHWKTHIDPNEDPLTEQKPKNGFHSVHMPAIVDGEEDESLSDHIPDELFPDVPDDNSEDIVSLVPMNNKNRMKKPTIDFSLLPEDQHEISDQMAAWIACDDVSIQSQGKSLYEELLEAQKEANAKQNELEQQRRNEEEEKKANEEWEEQKRLANLAHQENKQLSELDKEIIAELFDAKAEERRKQEEEDHLLAIQLAKESEPSTDKSVNGPQPQDQPEIYPETGCIHSPLVLEHVKAAKDWHEANCIPQIHNQASMQSHAPTYCQVAAASVIDDYQPNFGGY